MYFVQMCLLYRLIVIAKRKAVQERFPIPLINRLEKHFLAMSTVLSPQQADIVSKITQWVKRFSAVNPGVIQRSKQRFSEGDAFIGYHGDTPAAVVLRACEELSEVRGNAVQARGSEQWEQCVLERAKFLLMQMCPPDALARLSHTTLAAQAAQCWQVYFKEQQHASLVACLHAELSSLRPDQSLCLQVTTHSRLLSLPDVDYIAEALGMPQHTVHSVLLQQFHTEQQFLREITSFFEKELHSQTAKLLVVQCDAGDQHGDLLACARHRLHEERDIVIAKCKERGIRAQYHIVSIVQLPRIAGGCFEGVHGGVWRSIHIDELRPPESSDCPPVTALVGKSMSQLFKQSIPHRGRGSGLLANEQDDAMEVEEFHRDDAMDVDEARQGAPSQPNSPLNLEKLLLSCIQGAVARLTNHDTGVDEAAECIRRRIDLLQFVLQNYEGRDVYSTFMSVLCQRIGQLLTERDERAGHLADKWVQSKALATGDLQAGGTFSRALWLKIQSTVTPLFAEILGILDRCSNMDLLRSDLGWVQQLWLQLLASPEVVPLSYESFLVLMREEEAQQLRQRVPMPAMGAKNQSFQAEFPFSWLVKQHIDAMMPQAVNVAEQSHESLATCLRNMLSETPLGRILGQAAATSPSDVMLRYLVDFAHMVYHVRSTEELQLVQLCLVAAQRELQSSSEGEPVLDVAGIHAAYSAIQGRLNCLAQLLAASPPSDISQVLKRFSSRSAEMVSFDPEILQILHKINFRCSRWSKFSPKLKQHLNSPPPLHHQKKSL